MPESPPDSSSEHPYSPQDACEPNLPSADSIYSSINQNMYKTSLLNPIIADNLIIGSHIVVAEQGADAHLLENGSLLDARMIQDGDGGLLLPDGNISEAGRQMLMSDAAAAQNYLSQRPDTADILRRNQNELLLLKNGDYDKSQLVHMGYGHGHGMEMPVVQRSGAMEGGAGALCEPAMDNMQAVYTNLQSVSKKRKLSQDQPLVKSEPGK